MDIVISERLKNYIIFSYIKDFVNDLLSVYEDNENLKAYKDFMENSDILTETQDFVQSFKYALSGKRKSKYCEGVFVDIPLFLSFKDENYNVIKNSLKYIAKIYENIELCEELVFFKKYSKTMTDNFQNRSDSLVEKSTSIEDIKDEENIKKIIESFKPDVEESKKEFQEKSLNFDRVMKIFLVDVYDKIIKMDLFEEDAIHIKKLISIFANTPVNKIMTKKLDILKEFMSIKNINNIPYKNLLSNMGGMQLF